MTFIGTNIESIETGEPWNKAGKGCMLYVADTFKVVHQKQQKKERDLFEIDLSRKRKDVEYETLKDVIIDVKKFSYMMDLDYNKFDLVFDGESLELYLPNHFHFGAIIKSITKQIMFYMKWI